ncbi:MAG: sulfatase [Rubrobacteraceae bacterium]|nr:sulfatase [Rubrobacteraceae bacterium]
MADLNQAKKLLWIGIYALFGLAAVWALAACFPSAQGTTPEDKKKEAEPPNVVLILTDDLTVNDINADTLKHMPNLKSLLVDQGTTFDNAFVTNSLCCPSRATILRGQYTHSHQILSNDPPQGGFQKFRFLGHEDSTMATWLQEAGYRTALFGKYLNGYSETYVPPGWDEWRAIVGNYLSNDLNENGHIVNYDPATSYDTDVLSDKASDYVTRTAGADPPFFTTDRPFLMYLGTKAPHQPATPAPRDANAYPDLSLPHPSSFDEKDVSDKPGWIRDNPPLSLEQKKYMEELNRKRLQSMLSVDDMIGKLMKSLKQSGELDNTYIFFTSDNGFHLGEHRLGAGKWTAYEEDIRIPLIVRGPSVPEGKTLHHLVLNNDLAPTFADLAGAKTPSFVDGRSLVPLLNDHPTPIEDWRQRFLIESVAERSGVVQPPFINESTVAPLLTGDPLPKNWRRTSAASAQSSEEWGRPWLKALRTEDYLYVDYKTGEHELYDLKKDPYELNNEYSTASPELKQRLESQLDALRQCSGEECRAAEGGQSPGQPHGPSG